VKHSEYAHRIDELLADTVIRDPQLHVLYCAAGLMAEAGEVTDLVLKGIKYDTLLDISRMRDELADVLFYLTRLMDLYDTEPATLRDHNIKKLEARHDLGLS